MNDKTIFAISGPNVEARPVAELLASLDISADVVERFAVVGGKVERGAVIECYGEPNGASVYGLTRRATVEVWEALRDAFELDCAWLERGDYAGCVLKAPKLQSHLKTREEFRPREVAPERTVASPWLPGDITLHGKVVRRSNGLQRALEELAEALTS